MFSLSVTERRRLNWRLRRLIFGAWMLYAPAVGHPQTAGDRSIAVAIEAQVAIITEPGAAQIRGLRVAWPGLIHQFYAQRGFRAAWDRPSVVNDLHRALRDSVEDGLDPKDYYTAE